MLDKIWGPHSIDRFASCHNAQLPRFNSAAWNPGTEAVDAFCQNWSTENNWIQDWKAELSNPALDDFCDTLPDVMLASRAGNTLSKYTGSWLRWKRWCQSNLSAGAACPAKPLHIAIYLRSLLDNANTVAPMDSALYSIRWAHSMAGIESPTCHPMVRATMEGCRRILAKPRKAKEPVDPKILATLVSQKNLSSLSDLRLLCLCLISYAGFMRVGELLSVKISDISFSDSHMEIKLHKRKTTNFEKEVL
uniref:Uncharacterized protein LOC102809450 n=1 Tax=Saccoglossus kowalevskii TaxID=10224 RepID=A0ABM0MGI5_SACKO|nr:PREDICTED: uncharacterized protein LOC102809450 [Saccoglossus kowalevskii]